MGYTEYLKPGDRKKKQAEMLARFENADQLSHPEITKTAAERDAEYAQSCLSEITTMLNDSHTKRINESAQVQENYERFVNTLITEAFMSIFNRSMDYAESEYDPNIARAYISNYIKTEGAATVLRKMKTNSAILSDMENVIEETCKKSGCPEDDAEHSEDAFKIEPETKNEFLGNLKNLIDIDDVSQSIQLRVADAMSSFINKTSEKKAKVDETIDQITKKVNPNASDEVKEAYKMTANSRIEEINNSGYTNLFGKLFENLSESAYKNDDMRRVYCENGKLNFDKVVQHVKTVYTVLEMFNTTKLENFTPEKIEEIVSSYSL